MRTEPLIELSLTICFSLLLLLTVNSVGLAADSEPGSKGVQVIIYLKDQPLHEAALEIKPQYTKELNQIRNQIQKITPEPQEGAESQVESREEERKLAKSMSLTAQQKSQIKSLASRMETKLNNMRRDILSRARYRMESSRDSLIQYLESIGAEITAKLRIVNGVAASVPSDKVEEIKNRLDVARVVEDKRMRALLDTSTDSINAEDWWDEGWDGDIWDVGIVDSGVEDNHPGLSSHLFSESDFSNQQRGVDDINGHGTHVAGIVASTDNTYQGVAFGLGKIVNAKAAYDDDGNDGGHAWMQWSDAQEAIDWAILDITDDADVINLSYGGCTSEDYTDMAKYLDAVVSDLDVPVSVSAGNYNPNEPCTREIMSPAVAYNIFSVGNIDDDNSASRSDDSINTSTSEGPTEGWRDKPDLSAPGTDIMSANNNYEDWFANDWVSYTGTSMAAPHLAGAALLLMDYGIYDPKVQKAILINTSRKDSGNMNFDEWDDQAGWGYIDLWHAYFHKDDYFTGDIGPNNDFDFYKGPLYGGDYATLVWDRRVEYGSGDWTEIHDLSDLDLHLYNEDTNTGIDGSTYSSDNVEQVEADSDYSNGVIKVYGYSATIDGRAEEPYALATEQGFSSVSGPSFGFGTSDYSVVKGDNFTVEVTVSNDGGLKAHDVTVEISIPSGLSINSGANPQSLGDIAAGSSATASWSLHADNSGNYTLDTTASSNSYGESFDGYSSFSVTVEEERQLCISPDPANHDFGRMSKGSTATWSFTVENCGGQTLNWSANDNKGWISLSPTSGSLSGGNSEQVTVTVDTSGLSYGSHTGDLDITNGTTKDGDINLYVNEPPDQPYDPSPSDGANDVDTGVDVCWQCSDPDGDSLNYDVWVEKGDSSPDKLQCGGTSNQCCDVSLDPDSHYYWKVRAGDGVDYMDGPVWEFETEPPQVDVTVATDPSGRTIKVDGTSHTSPYTFTCTSGNNHDLTAPSPQAGSTGTRYVYDHWSDGGSQNHTISCPSSNKTYTAYFNTQYELTTSSDPSEGGSVSRDPSKDWYNDGESVQLTANPSSGYQFDNWSGDLSGSANPESLNVNSPKSVTAHFNKPPTASFDYSPSNPSTADTVNFTDQSTDNGGSIESWNWDFGDGDTSTAQNPSHSYSDDGSYTVELTVTDDDGATDSASKTVSVGNVAPTAENDSATTDEDNSVTIDVLVNDDDPDGSLQPGTVNVTSGPANGTTNVDTSTGKITYTPNEDYHGDDSFEYTVDDDDGATSNEATVSITVNDVNDSPIAKFDYSPEDPDTSDDVEFDASGSSDSDGTVDTYKWDWNNDGSFEDTLSSPTVKHSFSTTGDHSVSLKVIDNGGASNTKTKTITIQDGIPPTPNPMTWEIKPHSTGADIIEMKASSATDPEDNGVEYYFEETTDSSGGSDSDWQDSNTYTNSGLETGTEYCYRVKARDKSSNQNETDWSEKKCAIPSPPETAAKFRVDKQGNVYADKSYYGEDFVSGNADLAEQVKVTGQVEPGDVLSLNPSNPQHYQKNQKPYSTFAAGVVSTQPGMTLGSNEKTTKATIALMGTVPVKATTENGLIQPGDLLTTSSKPGYAMVCNNTNKCAGAIIGKALESLEEGEGKIRILVVS